MGQLCSSESLLCKVVYGIIAVVIAAILCGFQRCFRKRLKKLLEIDIVASRGDTEYSCSTISDGTSALPTNNQRNIGVHINCMNSWHPPYMNQHFGHYIHSAQHVTVLNPNVSVQVSNHSTLQTSPYSSGLPFQSCFQTRIPTQERMSHMTNIIPNNVEEGQGTSVPNTHQHQRSFSGSNNSQKRTANEGQISDNGHQCRPIFWRFVYFFLMSLYLYDFIADVVLSFEYFIRGEFQDFMLSIAPGATSVLFSIPILLYLPATHVGVSCLFVVLIVVTSPFAKAIIYGWMVNIGEGSWQRRWYLQALTFLQLLEVCIEGIPQFIFEYYIFLTESQTLYQSLQSIQKWFTLVSLLAVSFAITSATTTLDREEDARAVYNEKLKYGIQHDKEYYWEKYKDNNSTLWYTYFVTVYIGRAFEFVPRCIIYTLFIREFGLKVFGYFVGIYVLIFFSFSVSCFRKVHFFHSKDNFLRPLIIISSAVGVFANLFFCFEWVFRFLWTKKELYIRYYVLFYIINLALCIANTSFAGGLMMYVILIPSTVVPQILLLLLRMHLRQRMTDSFN